MNTHTQVDDLKFLVVQDKCMLPTNDNIAIAKAPTHLLQRDNKQGIH